VAEDLAPLAGPTVVVFVTDGKETCKGDPAAEVALLVDQGVEVALNIVGFALDDEALKAEMATWAALGGGTFIDAQDGASLLSAVTAALRAPYRVYDEAGNLLARGVVGGPAVKVPGYGVYRVEVLAEPPVSYEDVALAPGDFREFVLEPTGS
jgi:hypothetical protein